MQNLAAVLVEVVVRARSRNRIVLKNAKNVIKQRFLSSRIIKYYNKTTVRAPYSVPTVVIFIFAFLTYFRSVFICSAQKQHFFL